MSAQMSVQIYKSLNHKACKITASPEEITTNPHICCETFYGWETLVPY